MIDSLPNPRDIAFSDDFTWISHCEHRDSHVEGKWRLWGSTGSVFPGSQASPGHLQTVLRLQWALPEGAWALHQTGLGSHLDHLSLFLFMGLFSHSFEPQLSHLEYIPFCQDCVEVPLSWHMWYLPKAGIVWVCLNDCIITDLFSTYKVFFLDFFPSSLPLFWFFKRKSCFIVRL